MTVSTSPSKSASDAALPVVAQFTFGSLRDTLPTSTVESKSNIDFGGPTKKFASTGTLFSFGTDHEQPASSITKNSGTMSSSSISEEQNSGGDVINQNKLGNFANFRAYLFPLQMIFRNLNKSTVTSTINAVS